MTERDDDALWREIVDHYGDRPRLSEDDLAQAADPEPAADHGVRHLDDLGDDDLEAEAADRFVPPDPPAPPLPPGPRLAAWLGVLVVPVLMLGVLVLRWHPPGIITLGLLAWFVGGFGYLVAAMPREPRDPYDDGAQL